MFVNISSGAISRNEMHEVSTSKSIPEAEEQSTPGQIRNNEEADVESNISKAYAAKVGNNDITILRNDGMLCHVVQSFSTLLRQWNIPQLFALLMKLCAMIQVSILQQPHRTVVANFVPGNFGLFRRNPWQPLPG